MTKIDPKEGAYWLQRFRETADQLPGSLGVVETPVSEILEELEGVRTFKRKSFQFRPKKALKQAMEQLMTPPPLSDPEWLVEMREQAKTATGARGDALREMVDDWEAFDRLERKSRREVFQQRLGPVQTVKRWYRRVFTPSNNGNWPADLARIYHAAYVDATGDACSLSELYGRAVERPLVCATPVGATDSASASEKPKKPNAVEDRPISPETDAFWNRLVDEYGGDRAACTELEPVRDGARGQALRLRMVRNAKSSIVGSLYRIKPDPLGMEFVDELIAACKRGVRVVVLVDSAAQGISFALTRKRKGVGELKKKLAELERAGGQIGWFDGKQLEKSKAAAQAHFKSLVVDGEEGMVDGRNINISYVSRMTDFGFRLRGPVIDAVGQEALRLLRVARPQNTNGYQETLDALEAELGARRERFETELSADPSRAATDFTLVTWNPSTDEGENKLTSALIDAIDHAERTVTLTTNFFFPAKRMRRALKRAAERGVRVRVVTTGRNVHRKPYQALSTAVGFSFGDLGKCEIYETTIKEHAKLFMVDGKIGAFGSYNASLLADDQYAEGMLFSRDPKVLDAIGAALKETIRQRTEAMPRYSMMTGKTVAPIYAAEWDQFDAPYDPSF